MSRPCFHGVFPTKFTFCATELQHWRKRLGENLRHRHSYTSEKHQQPSSKHWADMDDYWVGISWHFNVNHPKQWIPDYWVISDTIHPLPIPFKSNHLHFVSDFLVSQNGLPNSSSSGLSLEGTWGHGKQRQQEVSNFSLAITSGEGMDSRANFRSIWVGPKKI